MPAKHARLCHLLAVKVLVGGACTPERLRARVDLEPACICCVACSSKQEADLLVGRELGRSVGEIDGWLAMKSEVFLLRLHDVRVDLFADRVASLDVARGHDFLCSAVLGESGIVDNF